jgi:hypothetical protein
VLTIRGERKSESDRNEQNFHVMERSHGRFQRSIQLPFAPDAEEVQATVREGVLEIRIPKRAPQERSRRIEVRGGESAGGGQSMTGAISGGSGMGSSSGGAGAPSSDGARADQGPGGSNSVTPASVARAARARAAAWRGSRGPNRVSEQERPRRSDDRERELRHGAAGRSLSRVAAGDRSASPRQHGRERPARSR